MESYGSYPPPKKNNTGLIVGLIIGGVVLCCVGPIVLLGGAGFWAFNKGKDLIVCGMAYQNVWQATEDYAQDHKGKLPHAATWMDDLRPYYKKVLAEQPSNNGNKMFGQMPAEGVWGCANDGGVQTGMAFNKDLDGKSLDGIKNRSQTIVIFESPTASLNQSAKYSPQPLATSPRMMNQPRGWFVIDANGNVNAGNAKFGRGFKGAPTVTAGPVKVYTETSKGDGDSGK